MPTTYNVDGQNYEVPDGTTLDQLQSYIGTQKMKNSDASKTAKATTPPATVTRTLGEKLKSGVVPPERFFKGSRQYWQERQSKAMTALTTEKDPEKIKKYISEAGEAGGNVGVANFLSDMASSFTSVPGALLLASQFLGPYGRVAGAGAGAMLGLHGIKHSGVKNLGDLKDPDKLEALLSSGSMLTGSLALEGTQKKPLAKSLREGAEKQSLRVITGGKSIVSTEEAIAGVKPGRAVSQLPPSLTLDSMHVKVRSKIDSINAQIEPLAAEASQRGVRIDVANKISAVFQNAIDKAVSSGNVTAARRLTKRWQDLQAVAPLHNMDPKMALRMKKGLQDEMGSLGKTDSILQKVIRQAQHEIGRDMGDKIPGMRELNRADTDLIKAEEGIIDRKEALKARGSAHILRLFGENIGDMMFAGAAMGIAGWAGVGHYYLVAPAVLAMRAMYKSVRVTSFQTYIKNRVANILDPEISRTKWPQVQQVGGQYMGQPGGPGQAPMGPGRQMPPGPVGGAPGQGPVPTPQAGPGLPPAAPVPGQGGLPAGPSAVHPPTAGGPPNINPFRQLQLPAPPPPKFRTGMNVKLTKSGLTAKITAVHGDSVTIQTSEGYHGVPKSDIEVVPRPQKASRSAVGSQKPKIEQSKTAEPSVEKIPEGEHSKGDLGTREAARERKAAQRERELAERKAQTAESERANERGEPITEGSWTPEQYSVAIETGLSQLDSLGPMGSLIKDAYSEAIKANRKMSVEDKYQLLFDSIKAAKSAGTEIPVKK